MLYLCHMKLTFSFDNVNLWDLNLRLNWSKQSLRFEIQRERTSGYEYIGIRKSEVVPSVQFLFLIFEISKKYIFGVSGTVYDSRNKCLYPIGSAILKFIGYKQNQKYQQTIIINMLIVKNIEYLIDYIHLTIVYKYSFLNSL